MGKQSYIGSKKVTGVRAIEDEKTPQGGQMTEVQFEDGSIEKMPDIRYKAMLSDSKSDASSAQDKLLKHVAGTIYGYMHEFDIRIGESQPLINEIIDLVNSGAIRATNLLWGVEHSDERSLLSINRVLQQKYGAGDGNDEGASNGEGAPGKDTDEK